MPIIDILLLILIGAFVWFGFFFGFVHTLGSFVGSIIGIVAAGMFIDPVVEKIGFIFGGGGFSRVILFIIIFVVIGRLIGMVFVFVEKVFHLFSIIPFAKSLNRFLGALLGFLEGVIVLGIISYYASEYLPQDTIVSALESSSIAEYLIATMAGIQVLFPEALKLISEV